MPQEYWPNAVPLYEPTDLGYEAEIKKRLNAWQDSKTKIDLRKEFLKKRDALDPAERARASSLIRQRITQHPKWRAAETVLFYVSFGSEVETHTLLQEALRFKKRVVVPAAQMRPAKKHPLFRTPSFRRTGHLSPRRPAGDAGISALQIPSTIELALIPGIRL